MKLSRSLLASFFVFFIGNGYCSYNEQINESAITHAVTLEQGYIRETIPGTTISAAYFTLNNTTGDNIVLTGITSHVSTRIELHQHSTNNGLMQMREVEHIIIPAQTKVVLQPFGLHVMIFNLEKGLQAQENIRLNLHFLNAKTKEVVLPVRSIKTERH